MGCNCKKKSKLKENKKPTRVKKNVIKLTETDLKNLINNLTRTC